MRNMQLLQYGETILRIQWRNEMDIKQVYLNDEYADGIDMRSQERRYVIL